MFLATKSHSRWALLLQENLFVRASHSMAIGKPGPMLTRAEILISGPYRPHTSNKVRPVMSWGYPSVQVSYYVVF